MSSPAVSIIVASYNYEQWLPQALQSALDQYVADFELLVVDDGSTDGSLAVAQDFAARDARVRVLTHADGGNHGLPATLALGLSVARGRWTAFLEADDVWTRDNLSLRLAAADGTDAGVIFNDVELWPMPGAATGWFTGYVPRVMAGHARRGGEGQRTFSLCGPMLVENVIPTFSCAMVRTELLRACDWQSPVPRWTDWWLWCQLACRTRFFLCAAPARALAPACDQPASRRGRRLPARLRPHGPGPGPSAGPGTHGRWAAALAVVPAPACGGAAGGTAGAHGHVPGPAQEPAAGRGASGPAQKLTPPATDLSRYRPDGLFGHGYVPECGM